MRTGRRVGAGAALVVLALGAVWVGRRAPRLSDRVPSYRQKGSADAPVVIMEYSDFQCPKCAQVQPDLRALVARYDGRVRLVFRHCPLPQHKWAALAAQAAEAAGLQNRFWEYADQLYAQQTAWSEQSDPRALFQQYAQELGLDVDRWKTDLDSSRLQELVKEERAHAQSLPIAATPTFFVNKKIIVGDSQLQAMGARFIEQELRR